MKIRRQKFSKKLALILAVIIVLLLASGALAYNYFSTSSGEESSEDSDSSSDDNGYESQQTLGEPTPEEEANTNESTKNEDPDKESNDNKSDATIRITAANQNGNMAQIRALIDKVWGAGECKLVMKMGSSTKTYTAPLQAQASASTCQGFNIPTSDLSPGTWNLELSATHNGETINTNGKIDISG